MNQMVKMPDASPEMTRLILSIGEVVNSVGVHAEYVDPMNGRVRVVNQVVAVCYEMLIRSTGNPETARNLLHEIVDLKTLAMDQVRKQQP